MKSNYECLFIISSNVSEDKRNEMISKFSKMTKYADVAVEKWGMRKFATPINYRNEGFYVLMNFASEPSVPAEITKLMNITDGVVRSMFVCKNEKEIAADKQRKAARAAQRAAAGETPAAMPSAPVEVPAEPKAKRAPKGE